MRLLENDSSKNGLKVRINELRDYFATFMVKHGLIREEVDLLQGKDSAKPICAKLLESKLQRVKRKGFQRL